MTLLLLKILRFFRLLIPRQRKMEQLKQFDKFLIHGGGNSYFNYYGFKNNYYATRLISYHYEIYKSDQPNNNYQLLFERCGLEELINLFIKESNQKRIVKRFMD